MYEESSFTGRLNALYSESGLSMDDFAKRCNVSRSAMQNYLSGERTPDSKRLIDFCQAFNVSADWLLGLSEVSTISIDVKTACEVTGLSEEAVKKLQSLEEKNKNSVTYALTALIENQLFENLMIEMDCFFDTVENLTIDDLQEYVPYTGTDGKVELGRNAAAMFFRNNVVSLINTICSDKYNEATQKICGDLFVAYSNGDGRKVFFEKDILKKLKREDSKE